MSEQKKCCGKIFGARVSWHVCARGAAYEHEGGWYCKTHYPPAIQEKCDKRNAEWAEKRKKQNEEYEAAKRAKEEKDRKANLFSELLEMLLESQISIGGDWRARRDALIERASGDES